MPRWSSMNKKVALCHPERKHHSRGCCRECYRKLPLTKATDKARRQTPKERRRLALYEKGPVKARAYRRYRHGFDAADEARFQAITICDWCGQCFDGFEKPDIDHDHLCCPRMKHCHKCTRGFVHHQCNIMAIAYYEWFERQWGIAADVLCDYRRKFPRRPS